HCSSVFSFDGATSPYIYTLSLHDALPISTLGPVLHFNGRALLPLPWLLVMPIPMLNNALPARFTIYLFLVLAVIVALWLARRGGDRKSTRLNSSHLVISYAVFCLKKNTRP